MPDRKFTQHHLWLLASGVLAVAYILLPVARLTGLTVLLLNAAPFLCLAAYGMLRQNGRDTKLLAIMLVLEAIGSALGLLFGQVALTMLMFAYFAGLSLFLPYRLYHIDSERKVAAACLTLLTPIVCYFASSRSGVPMPVFFGLSLGGMAAAAWLSAFPRWRVGIGGVLIVVGNVLALAASGGNASLPLAFAAWPLFYIGNFLLAVGVAAGVLAQDRRAGDAWED